MVLYEVNIKVDSSIFQEYMSWLKLHLLEMLKIDGFKTARNFIDIDSNEVVVHYEIESEEKLENYFNKQAAAMRKGTIDKFGDKIAITRRVLKQN